MKVVEFLSCVFHGGVYQPNQIPNQSFWKNSHNQNIKWVKFKDFTFVFKWSYFRVRLIAFFVFIPIQEWGLEGYQLWLISSQTGVEDNVQYETVDQSNIIQMQFVKSALTVNPCMVGGLYCLHIFILDVKFMIVFFYWPFMSVSFPLGLRKFTFCLLGYAWSGALGLSLLLHKM